MSGDEEWVRAQVAARLDEAVRTNGGGPSAKVRREFITAALEQRLSEQVRLGRPLPGPAEVEAIARKVEMTFTSLGGFGEALADPSVEEVHANGCDNVWVKYADDPRSYPVGPVARTDENLVELARHVIQTAGLISTRFDDEVPFATVDLGDGSRFSAMMRITGRRPRVSICRPVVFAASLDELRARGMMDEAQCQLLRAVVRARKTVLVCGGHGFGKTTCIRALLGEAEVWERKVCIQKFDELQLERFPELHPNVLPLLVRLPNQEGKGGISQSTLVDLALISRPDRLVVGEVLGDEAVPMLYALSGGVDGSLFTIHAADATDVFERLVLLAGGAPQRVDRRTTLGLAARGIRFIVHLRRDREGNRVVAAIHEVEAYRQDTDTVHTGAIFEGGREGPGVRTSTPVRCLDDLIAAGLDPRWEERW